MKKVRVTTAACESWKPIRPVVLRTEKAVRYLSEHLTPISEKRMNELHKKYEPYLNCFKDE